jgi:glycosyltransferase involved in cell wall biosynthesis
MTVVSSPLPPVSVVVAARNEEKTIGSCLDSLQALSYPADRLEIIIVDNGSTDQTRARVRAGGDGCRLVVEERRGPAAARNRGVAEAKHGVIAFTDADCVVDPGWLVELVQPLHNPEIGVCGGAIRAIHPHNAVMRFGESIHDHQKAIEHFEPPYAITMNWASPCSVLRAHPFDESLLRGEDSDLSLRLWAAGYRFAYCAEAIIRHHHRDRVSSLIYEGYQHGFWAVAVQKKLAALRRERGLRRWYPSTYRALLRDLRGGVRGPDRAASLLSLAFNLGKKSGKVAGSMRFGFLSL